MSQNQSFTGRARKRTTSWSVRISDVLARALITVGGIGTIIAVTTVGLFLFYVVVPLFYPADIAPQYAQQPEFDGHTPVYMAIDEYRSLGLVISGDAQATTFRLSTGDVLHTMPLIEEGGDGAGSTVTSHSIGVADDSIALGFADGTVRLGEIGFESTFLSAEDVPENLRDLAEGEIAPFRSGVVERTPTGQFRLQQAFVNLEDPIKTGSDAPIVRLDHVDRDRSSSLVTMDAEGNVRVFSVRKIANMLTGKTTLRASSGDLPFKPKPDQKIVFVGIDQLGANVYVVAEDGAVQRFETRSVKDIELAEVTDVTADGGDKLTAVRFVLGRSTLVFGTDAGEVDAWFTVEDKEASTPDKRVLKLVHTKTMGEEGAAVTALAPSARSRTMAVGYADGSVRVYNITTTDLMGEVAADTGGEIKLIQIAPKEDGIAALTANGVQTWSFDPRYPEASMRSLFLRVWYESRPSPEHTWQSSAATDDAEMKLGMIPLIFGTLKATFYSLIFAVPIAIFAAIYTSEFMDPKLKSVIKPTVEMMASLPSVVLGFLAGLVIAPMVENVVPAMLAGFIAIPFILLLGAFLWQMMPHKFNILLEGWPRFVVITLTLPIGVAVAMIAGPIFESLLFAGSIKGWLAFDPSVTAAALDAQLQAALVAGDQTAADLARQRMAWQSPFGGWFLILLPLCATGVAILMSVTINGWFRNVTIGWDRGRATALNLAKFLTGCAAVVSIASFVALLLGTLGFDPRGDLIFWGMNLSPASTYVQRNALIVGFAMGFAVIPIIYTIAEDAMTAVPEHLRSASLGAGASPWQTAIRVVVPTAMSGIFSACMVGLGRAVGETMIVLMAAGNTPILDLNIFEGFRTLSANIATELPEAVQHSTHYRTLFLSALVLFIMTFFVNTLAEVVRQRFRKRALNL